MRMGGEGEGQEGGVDGDDEMKSLRLTKSRLEDKLRKTENMHHMELQESKVCNFYRQNFLQKHSVQHIIKLLVSFFANRTR